MKKKKPPVKTPAPPKGAFMKGISKHMKQIKPPKVGGKK